MILLLISTIILCVISAIVFDFLEDQYPLCFFGSLFVSIIFVGLLSIIPLEKIETIEEIPIVNSEFTNNLVLADYSYNNLTYMFYTDKFETYDIEDTQLVFSDKAYLKISVIKPIEHWFNYCVFPVVTKNTNTIYVPEDKILKKF